MRGVRSSSGRPTPPATRRDTTARTDAKEECGAGADWPGCYLDTTGGRWVFGCFAGRTPVIGPAPPGLSQHAIWTRPGRGAPCRLAKRLMDTGPALGHSSGCEESPLTSHRHPACRQSAAGRHRGGVPEPALEALRPQCSVQPWTRWSGFCVWARRGGSATVRRSGSFGEMMRGPARAGERAPTAGVLGQAPAAGRPWPSPARTLIASLESGNVTGANTPAGIVGCSGRRVSTSDRPARSR